MCVGVPGVVTEIRQDGATMTMGKVSFAGEVKDVCLAYVPDVKVGEYVIVHVGFALGRVDEEEAQELLRLLEQMGGLDVPDGQEISPGSAPAMSWSGSEPTSENVPLFLNWPPAVDGLVVDNTDIFHLMEDFLYGSKAPQVENLEIEDVTHTSVTIRWTTKRGGAWA